MSRARELWEERKKNRGESADGSLYHESAAQEATEKTGSRARELWEKRKQEMSGKENRFQPVFDRYNKLLSTAGGMEDYYKTYRTKEESDAYRSDHYQDLELLRQEIKSQIDDGNGMPGDLGSNLLSGLDSISEAIASYEDYYGQWNSREDYERYVELREKYHGSGPEAVDSLLSEIEENNARLSALKGERNADRLSGLPGVIAAAAQASALGTQSGQMLMPSELHAEEIAALEKKKALLQEEQDWAMFYKYHDLMDRGDFEEKSKYVSTANGEERGWLERVQGLYGQENSPWDDPLYEYINGNAGAGLEISNQAAAKWKGLPLAEANARTTKGQERVEQMTEDEVKIFNYLYATQGKDAAYEYYDYLKTSLNARQQEADAAAIGEAIEANPVVAAAASVLSVGMAPMKGLSYLGQIADLADDGKIDENDAYNRYSYLPGAIRGQISDKIEQSGKWGKVGSFAYQTAMSMGDFLINAGITGGYSPLTLSIMGTGAAADGTIEAKKRGLDDGQAFLLGTIAGAAEIITEKVSLEALLDVDMLKDSVKKYILKNMLAEGSEEVGSDFINLIADIAVAKNKTTA